MNTRTFQIKVTTKSVGYGARVLRSLIEAFKNQSVKPNTIEAIEKTVYITFKIDADDEFEAWEELNNIVKTTIDPAIEKAKGSISKRIAIESIKILDSRPSK